MSGQQRTPSGTLRISVAMPYGHFRVLPLIPKFREQYPAVRVEANLNNRNIDFAAEGYDLAVRGRTPPESGLVARKLEDADVVVVAAPAYLRRHGLPASPADLAAHDCIQFVLPSTGQPVPWEFRHRGKDMQVFTRGGTSCSDDPAGAVTLARHGAGVLQIYRFLVDEALRVGELVEVLQDYGGRSRPFSLLYPQNRHMPLRVRVFFDFVLKHVHRSRLSTR